ncbi:hypothetical protein DFH06DRAFT_1225067 [Mycena polygramma]|nr:hypothetical protein DFH06DRAFT_1225067 [Mycena polygramma]
MMIPDIVARNYATTPEAPFYVFARDSPTTEIVTITNFEFGRATHRVARALRPNPASPSSDGKVVAIIAFVDTVLYHAVVAGLITANLIPSSICPVLTPTAIVDLLRKSACHRMVTTRRTLGPLILAIEEELRLTDPVFQLSIEEIPSLLEIYPNLGSETATHPFQPYNSGGEKPSLDDICMYQHSSGTTGLPKCIPHTHRSIMHFAQFDLVTDLRRYVGPPHASGAMGQPPFAFSGMSCQLLGPLYGGVPVAVYPPTVISPELLPISPTPDNMIACARNTNCKAILTLPGALMAWFKSPETMEFLKSLNIVLYGGGSLAQPAGDALSKAGVNIRPIYAGTEFGGISAITPLNGDESDWNWMRFTDGVTPRWIPQGEGVFECQLLTSDTYQPSVENLNDVKGYATSDLWVNHPEKTHLWKLIGRINDVIVHSSGKKTIPTPIEEVVVSSPDVVHAFVFGSGLEAPGILIQCIPTLQIDVTDKSQVAALRDKIWPVVEAANAISPEYSRISKQMILFTPADKPLPRSVVKPYMIARATASQLYSREIAELYI